MRAAYSTPLVTDQLAVQVSAFDRQDPGYINDPLQGRSHVNEAHVSGGRIALNGNLTDFLTIKLSALYQQMKSGGSNMVDIDVLRIRPSMGPTNTSGCPGWTDSIEHLQFYTLNLTAGSRLRVVDFAYRVPTSVLLRPEDYTPAFRSAAARLLSWAS